MAAGFGSPMMKEMNSAELYNRDYYEWTVHNAELLRAGRADEADLQHIAEELEDMGKREKRALRSRLSLLISHLLKWHFQPERRTRSWEATIRFERRQIEKLLAEMPSLKEFLAENLEETYRDGVVLAVADTGLPEDDFPSRCQFNLDQLLREDHIP